MLVSVEACELGVNQGLEKNRGGFAFAGFQLLWIMPVRPCMARPSLFGSD
jgi:hypothetical protein